MSERKIDMQERIIDKAWDYILENGYSALSVRGLARELDISVGNLNYYFPTLQSIVEAVGVRAQTMTGILFSKPVVSIEELDEAISKGLQMLQLVPVANINALGMAQTNAYMRKFFAQHIDRVEGFLSGSLENLFKEGLVRQPFFDDEYEHFARTAVMSTFFRSQYLELKYPGAERSNVTLLAGRDFWLMLYPWCIGRALWYCRQKIHELNGQLFADGEKS